MKILKSLASVLLLLFFWIFPLLSQENPDTSYWKLGGLGSISLSQVSLTNWAAGGENSFSGNFLANGLANYSIAISKFMAPGYINLSIGMDYKPSENFNVYFGPLSGKVTFVLDDTLSHYGAFGLEPD